jgi:sialidase-1
MSMTALVCLLALGPMDEEAPPASTPEQARPAAAPIENADVFVERVGGYFAYRIPALETAQDGTLLAFAEARKYNLEDPGFGRQDIDLVLRRSTDGGRTWEPMQVIEDPGELWSAANPATVVDRTNGRVWLLYLRCKPQRNTHTARPGTDDSQVLARTSDDAGRTWSEPIDLTAVSRDFADPKWRVSVVGPGGMIQDRKGRLVAAIWKFEPFGNFALISGDHGKTWHRSAFVPGSGDECQLVELTDGRLLMDIRQGKGPHRHLSTSRDGGETWSKPRPGVTVSPVACAIERYTSKAGGDDRDRILWTGPKGPGRQNLVVRISYDEGETFPVERPIAAGHAAYSDLSILKDRSVGVLWERGADHGYQTITFTRLTREFLEPPAR